MDALEERILDHEICLLADEAIKNDFRFDLNTETPRSIMARAQMVMIKELMEYLMRLEDWAQFEPERWLALQRTQYQKARAAGDREAARISLARVRLLTRLLKRLTSFKRGRLMELSLPQMSAGESPPPLALRRLKEQLVQRGEWDQDAASMFAPMLPSFRSDGRSARSLTRATSPWRS